MNALTEMRATSSLPSCWSLPEELIRPSALAAHLELPEIAGSSRPGDDPPPAPGIVALAATLHRLTHQTGGPVVGEDLLHRTQTARPVGRDLVHVHALAPLLKHGARHKRQHRLVRACRRESAHGLLTALPSGARVSGPRTDCHVARQHYWNARSSPPRAPGKECKRTSPLRWRAW